MVRRAAALSAVVVGGCSIFMAGCDQTRQYAGFAQLGSTYAAAVDKVLLAAAAIKIDASSEQLLADKRLAAPSVETYRKLTNVDEERLKIIGRLRLHVRLMGLYFAALNDLAASNAPDAAAAAASGAAQDIAQLGLKTSAANVVAPLAKLAVSSVLSRELRQELDTRQITIRTELAIQEKLIEELTGIVQQDVAVLREKLENREVIAPLIAPDPIPHPQQWAATRKVVLTLSTATDDLNGAAAAVQKLRVAFESLISGKLTADRVNSLLTDFNAILSIGVTVR
jgi:hypothetical protein